MTRAIGGPLLAALALASCLPLDDLSRYSRGGPADAGHPLTAATSAPDAATPEPPSRPPPRSAGTDASPSGPSPGTEPREAPPASAPDVDAGTSPPALPEGCVARVDADAGAGSCYLISREPASWSLALAACVEWGGSLVSINSGTESDWLAAMVDVTIWIGANDRRREGSFEWASGEPFELELFAAGEPDNTLGVQDCVERRRDASWNDRACTVQNAFVCERPL